MQKVSHSATLRAQYSSNKLNVLYLTNMDDDSYRGFVFEIAHTWLKTYFADVVDVEALINSEFFWKWFINNWNYLDDTVYLPQLWNASKSARLSLYRQLHQEIFDTDNIHSHYIQEDFTALMDEWTNQIIDIKTAIV